MARGFPCANLSVVPPESVHPKTTAREAAREQLLASVTVFFHCFFFIALEPNMTERLSPWAARSRTPRALCLAILPVVLLLSTAWLTACGKAADAQRGPP